MVPSCWSFHHNHSIEQGTPWWISYDWSLSKVKLLTRVSEVNKVTRNIYSAYDNLQWITMMSDNLVNYELLFVLLSNINWIDTMRIKYEGTQIMNVRLDRLASDQIFNDVYRLLMSYHLIRSSMFGK